MIDGTAGPLASARRTLVALSTCVCTVLVVAATVSVASASASSAGVISRFAGTGTSGVPTPGPAISSDLGASFGVAVDSSGNVYFSDAFNFEVDKVTPDGTLSIIAGTGTQGSPTPGPATSSELKAPAGVAVNAAGDVYIADSSARVVEEVTPAGVLSIVAGTGVQGAATPGPATSSELENPGGVGVDGQGDLFITDPSANRVYKVTADGTLSIFAGTGTSGAPTPGPATSSPLHMPEGVLAAPGGDVYIADFGNGEVEQVTSAGTLSIFAGTGTQGSPTPGPATSSELGQPAGLGMDAVGNLYIADGQVVSEVSPAGALTIAAGNGTFGAPTYGGLATASPLNSPFGVAITPTGRLYIADSYNATIDEVASPLPVATAVPAISGTTTSGQTLSATTGTWTESPEIYTYQWQDCDSTGANCTAISNATASSYTLTSDDVGHTVQVTVTAENSGGIVAASSAVSAVIAAAATAVIPPTTTPIVPIITPTLPGLVGLATTTAATKLTGQSARLGGIVAAHSGSVSYRFRYGTSRTLKTLTALRTLPASTSAQAVGTLVARLVPGTTYRYQLMVTTSAGTTSYAPAKTLQTPRVTPRRVRAQISDTGGQHAAHGYRLSGRIMLGRGLSDQVGCKTQGAVTVTVTRGTKVIARHRVDVSTGCTYTTTFSFPDAERRGSGRVGVHVTFAGNRQLRARSARTLHVA